jgi:hypothetical protein
MRKNKAEYEDNNKINNFLSSGGSGITDESSKKKSSSFGSDERKMDNSNSNDPWEKRVNSERLLISKASKFLESQKREVKRRQKRLEKEKGHWQEDMRVAARQKNSRGGLSRSKRRMLKEIKRGLQQQSDELNAAINQLMATEKWLYEREKKVAKMENIVRQKVGNDTMDESSLFADSFDLNFGTNSGGGGTSPSPETSDLERLSDELDSDFSNMSMADNATAFDPSSGGWKSTKRSKKRSSKQKQYMQQQNPYMQWPQHGNPYAAWGSGAPYVNHPYGSGAYPRATFGSRVPMSNISNDRVMHGFQRAASRMPPAAYNDVENMNVHVERQWMDRGRPVADRFGNKQGNLLSNPDIQHRLSVFQNQLKRWSGEQKTAYDAVGDHSKWLKNFGSAMNKFSLYNNGNTGAGISNRVKKAVIGGTGGKSTSAAVLSPRVKQRTMNQIMADVNESFSNEI